MYKLLLELLKIFNPLIIYRAVKKWNKKRKDKYIELAKSREERKFQDKKRKMFYNNALKLANVSGTAVNKENSEKWKEVKSIQLKDGDLSLFIEYNTEELKNQNEVTNQLSIDSKNSDIIANTEEKSVIDK